MKTIITLAITILSILLAQFSSEAATTSTSSYNTNSFSTTCKKKIKPNDIVPLQQDSARIAQINLIESIKYSGIEQNSLNTSTKNEEIVQSYESADKATSLEALEKAYQEDLLSCMNNEAQLLTNKAVKTAEKEKLAGEQKSEKIFVEKKTALEKRAQKQLSESQTKLNTKKAQIERQSRRKIARSAKGSKRLLAKYLDMEKRLEVDLEEVKDLVDPKKQPSLYKHYALPVTNALKVVRTKKAGAQKRYNKVANRVNSEKERLISSAQREFDRSERSIKSWLQREITDLERSTRTAVASIRSRYERLSRTSEQNLKGQISANERSAEQIARAIYQPKYERLEQETTKLRSTYEAINDKIASP